MLCTRRHFYGFPQRRLILFGARGSRWAHNHIRKVCAESWRVLEKFYFLRCHRPNPCPSSVYPISWKRFVCKFRFRSRHCVYVRASSAIYPHPCYIKMVTNEKNCIKMEQNKWGEAAVLLRVEHRIKPLKRVHELEKVFMFFGGVINCDTQSWHFSYRVFTRSAKINEFTRFYFDDFFMFHMFCMYSYVVRVIVCAYSRVVNGDFHGLSSSIQP